jgi:hypothetical protein
MQLEPGLRSAVDHVPSIRCPMAGVVSPVTAGTASSSVQSLKEIRVVLIW